MKSEIFSLLCKCSGISAVRSCCISKVTHHDTVGRVTPVATVSRQAVDIVVQNPPAREKKTHAILRHNTLVKGKVRFAEVHTLLFYGSHLGVYREVDQGGWPFAAPSLGP